MQDNLIQSAHWHPWCH